MRFVSSAEQLHATLAAARPGSVIRLADGVYEGRFRATRDGTENAPITIRGSRQAILTTGSLSVPDPSTSEGIALHITGDHYRIQGLRISFATKGLVLDDSDDTVIDGVRVGDIGEEAIHVRKNSAGVTIRDSSVHDTGRWHAGYGEGIYVGSAKANWKRVMGSASIPDRSNRVLVKGNFIWDTSAEGVDIKEGTSRGRVTGNRFSNSGFSGAHYGDSWIDVKGNHYLIEHNSGFGTRHDAIQVHRALDGWGGWNIVQHNVVRGGVPGWEVRMRSPTPGNVVRCQPSLAAKGLSNYRCSP